MKKLSLCLVLAVLPFSASASFLSEDAPPANISGAGSSFETAFSPPVALSPTVVKAIDSATKSVRVSARAFNSKAVSEALFRAYRNNKDVKVVLSRKSNSGVYSASQFLLTMSMEPHVTRSDDGLYADYIVIDEKDVVEGNIAGFTDEEDEKKNAGEVLIIHDAPELAKRYLAHWQTQWDASDAMKQEKEKN